MLEFKERIENYLNDINNIDNVCYQSIARMRRICNTYDVIICSISGGKDSTISFNLLKNELALRAAKQDFQVDHGNGLFDIEEMNDNMPFVIINFQDPEIIYSMTRDYIINCFKESSYGVFRSKITGKVICGFESCDMHDSNLFIMYQTERDKLVKYFDILVEPSSYPMHGFFKCLNLRYSNSLTDDRTYISYNGNKNIFDFPSIEELGFEAYVPNIREINNISPKLYDYLKLNRIFKERNYSNFGVGDHVLQSSSLKNFKMINEWSFLGQKCEDDQLSEVNTFSKWMLESFRDDIKICNLVSLRKEESLTRRQMLGKYVDVFTGKYGEIKL